MKNGVLLTLGSIFLLIFSATLRGEEPNPYQVSINSINHWGSGCGEGTARALLAPDAQAFTMIFDDFYVEADGGDKERKICTVNFDLKFPSGWEYSLLGVQFRGYADLERGTNGFQQVVFAKSKDGPRYKLGLMKLNGDYNDNYMRVDDIPITNLKWIGCDGSKNLFMHTGIQINAGATSGGYMTIDTVDGSITQDFELVWRKCQQTQRNILAACVVSLTHPHYPGKSKQFIAKGKGKTKKAALHKAKAFAIDKCKRLKSRFPGLNCDGSREQCKTISL